MKTQKAICIFIILAGWFNSIAVLMTNVDRYLPFSVYFYGDSEIYLGYAESILNGYTYDLGLPFHPPLAAAILAGLLYVFRALPGLLAVKIMLGLFAGLTACVTALCGMKLAGRWPGVLCGLLAAFSFGIAVISATPSNEAPYLLISLLTFYIVIAWESLPFAMSGVLGVLTALGCLCRTEHLLLAPLLMVFVSVSRRGRHARSGRGSGICLLPFNALAFFLALVICLTPWTLRNLSVISDVNLDQLSENPSLEPLPVIVPLTIYGPLNFALANLPPANGEFTRESLPSVDGDYNLNLMNPVHRDFLLHGYKIGWDAWKKDPGRMLDLWINKLRISMSALSNGFFSANYPAGLAGVRRPIDLFSPHHDWMKYPVLLLAMTGFTALYNNNRKTAFFLTAIIVHRLVVVVAFFGYVRQGSLLLPFIFIMIAGNFLLIRHRWKDRIVQTASVLLLIVALVVNGIGFLKDRPFEVKYGTLNGSQTIDQHLELELIPK